MTRHTHHRGSVYLATLGAAMLVTILGVSALLVVRMQREAADLDRDAAQATFAARSAVEVALREVQNNTNWRTSYTHNNWSSTVNYGRVTYKWKFVSTAGSSLSGYPNDPVRVVGYAAVGDAVRLESVLLRPVDLKGAAAGSNILTNPGFDSNTTNWGLVGGAISGVLDLLTTHTAPGALTVSSRSSTSDGAYQDVTAKLVNGMTYDTYVWVKSALLTSDSMRIQLVVTSTGDGTQTFSTNSASYGSLSWKQVTGSLTPKWKGQLISARWQVITTSNTYSFTIDDAYLAIASSSPRPHILDTSSWRQELP